MVAEQGGICHADAHPDAAYLPRAVFFGRLGFAGVFFSVWAGDFGRFFPAMSGSFPVIG